MYKQQFHYLSVKKKKEKELIYLLLFPKGDTYDYFRVFLTLNKKLGEEVEEDYG